MLIIDLDFLYSHCIYILSLSCFICNVSSKILQILYFRSLSKFPSSLGRNTSLNNLLSFLMSILFPKLGVFRSSIDGLDSLPPFKVLMHFWLQDHLAVGTYLEYFEDVVIFSSVVSSGLNSSTLFVVSVLPDRVLY